MSKSVVLAKTRIYLTNVKPTVHCQTKRKEYANGNGRIKKKRKEKKKKIKLLSRFPETEWLQKVL